MAQACSAIMSGKINPSMAAMLNQACCQVLGNDTRLAHVARASQLELNMLLLLIIYS